MKFELTRPCAKCPFRNDIKPYLLSARIAEITEGLLGDLTFSCHETNSEDDDGDTVETKDSQHCAGALIFLEKLDRPNQMMRIAERMGFYDRHKLDMDSPVFDNPECMIENAEGIKA